MRLPAGLKTLAELAQPATLRRLHSAGALGPASPLAMTAAAPWLLGRGPSLGVAAQLNAIQVGGKPAISDRYGTITWRRLDTVANRTGRALAAAGMKPGDRVAMLLRNGREFAQVLLAAQKHGFIACPLNTWARPKELSASLDNVSPRIVVYDAAHGEQLRESLHSQATLISTGMGEPLAGSIPFEEFVSSAGSAPPFPFVRDRGSARIIIHTSGTTGLPRGARRDAAAIGLGALANLVGVVPYRRSDAVFCPAPMFHSFGLVTFTLATALGATLILPDAFDPEESLALIEKHRATAASFVPVMIRRILDLGEEVRSRYDLSSLRIVLASGAAMSPALRAAAAEIFGHVLYDLYGSTEAGWVTIATPDDMRLHPTTAGKPVPGVEVAALDADGSPMPAGEDGELYVRSGVLFDGYTSGESRRSHGGFVSIGDVGHFDTEGFLYVEGRSDDMVVVGAENVYPIEVEEVIESIEGIVEVAVLGVPDEEFGQVLSAFVVGTVDGDTVRARCAAELASYKVPRRIEVLDELPRTGTGKVLKRELLAHMTAPDEIHT
jgi:acyl-CoA synthetase (AMP-forming)/AMP-acid ligase II